MQTFHNRPVVQAWQTAVQEETRSRPWLAPFLLRQSPHLFTRFADYYGQLLAAPRKVRRQLGAGLATAALALALSQTPAHAATITVTPDAAGINVGDGCSLVEAIINANNNAATHAECDLGTAGADTIELTGNTYSYTTAYNAFTFTALPNITSPITIEANGATIQRAVDAPNMRILYVTAGGNLTLNNATITGGSGVIVGGGIYNNNSILTLNNSTVSGNTATSLGGGISNGGTLTLNNSTVSGNTGTNGGGIFNGSGTLTLNNSTVSGNTGTNGGGGIRNDSGTLTVNNSTVSGNTGTNGGGLSNYSANGNCTATPGLIVNNSTVSGNTATNRGGGILNLNGVAEISHSTVTSNSAPANNGAGVHSFNDGDTCTRMGGSIIAGNLTGGDVAAASTVQRFYSLGHNLIGTAGGSNVNFTLEFTATGDITNNATPGLAPLADNGGPTLTHALLLGSPAIDIIALDGSVCILDTSTDQRGGVRGSGANRGDGACDAGAYEFNSSQTPTAVTNLLTQTTSQPPTTILALLATLLAAFSGARLWRRR